MLASLEASEKSTSTHSATSETKGTFHGRCIRTANCCHVAFITLIVLAALGSAIGGFILMATAKNETNRRQGLALGVVGSVATLLFGCLDVIAINRLRG